MLFEITEGFDWTKVMLTVSAFVLISVAINMFRTKPHLPPQPGLALPLIGHLYKLKTDPRPQFKQWRNEYGDVFSFYLGTTLMVVLNGYSTIKEAFLSRSDEFSNRPVQYFDLATGIPGRGVVSSNDADWREQRGSIQSFLRRFGVGKNPMAEKITEEVLHLAERLEALEGKPQDIFCILNVSISNILCTVLVGKRFEYDDKDFPDLMKHIAGLSVGIRSTGPLNVYPALRHIPGDPFDGKKTEMHMTGIIELFAKRHYERIGVDDKNVETGEPDSIITAYIQEMNKKKKAGVSTFMDRESLRRIIIDMFIAGTETTSTTIYWALLYAILHPEVQEKVFSEIESEVGTERLPTVQDRNKLVYLNAFIMETQRLGEITPLGLPHTNPQDAKLHGYDIPKGSHIIANFDSVFTDPEVWGKDVQTFRPERFIDSSGHLIHREELVPFSLGKRVCPGEALAMMDLFLYFSILFQRFKFLPADEKNLPTTVPEYGAANTPQHYELRAIRR